MTDYEYYRDKYYIHLEYLSKFPVWTRQHIESILHIEYRCLQKLVNVKLLYKFNVGRFTFYTVHNKHFTNQSIVKSILRIDSYFRTRYGDINDLVYDNKLDNNSLVSSNVEKIGYTNRNNYITGFYSIYNIRPVLTVKDFKKIEKLLIDIYTASGCDFVNVGVVVYNTNIKALEDYLESSGELLTYKMCSNIDYYIVNVDSPHLEYLSYNL